MKVGKYTIHLHSISVHFTNGLYPVAVLFLILFEIFSNESFSSTYFYLMVIATCCAPISYFTGIIEWKQKYRGVKIKIFVRKYTYGIILIGIGSFCTGWSYISPEIISDSGPLHSAFILLNLAILPLVAYLGYLGGKLVFGGGH